MNINRDGLLILFTYNAYANSLLMDAVAQLDDEALSREFSPSHGSVRKLLLHMLGTEASFLAVCRGEPISRPNLSTAADIRDSLERLGEGATGFIASLSDEDLAREVTVKLIGGRPFRFSIGQLLLQAFLHSTQHRGELSILLSELGHPIPNLDIIIHFAELSGQPWE